MQFGTNLKLKAKFFGPYKIIKIKEGNTFDVSKEGYYEGPQYTSACSEFIKPWTAIAQKKKLSTIFAKRQKEKKIFLYKPSMPFYK